LLAIFPNVWKLKMQTPPKSKMYSFGIFMRPSYLLFPLLAM